MILSTAMSIALSLETIANDMSFSCQRCAEKSIKLSIHMPPVDKWHNSWYLFGRQRQVHKTTQRATCKFYCRLSQKKKKKREKRKAKRICLSKHANIQKMFSCQFSHGPRYTASWLVGRFYGISNLVGYIMPNPIYIQGSLNRFLDFFRMGTFIDSTHMKLWYPSK